MSVASPIAATIISIHGRSNVTADAITMRLSSASVVNGQRRINQSATWSPRPSR
jgi:hypothetical protein